MKHGLFTSIFVFLTVVMPIGDDLPAYGALFTIGGAFDYETAQLDALWWPDPNGGAGVMMMTDSLIAETTSENFAVGPCVEFSLTGLTDTLWDTILPGDWKPSDANLAEAFGKLAILHETEDGGGWVGIVAAGWRFLPGRTIRPTIWTEYLRPEGSSNLDMEVKVLAGVTVWLGKP
ncbi:MAG: hypothetical protein V2A79_10230 [Planctomycetota bacterium]